MREDAVAGQIEYGLKCAGVSAFHQHLLQPLSLIGGDQPFQCYNSPEIIQGRRLPRRHAQNFDRFQLLRREDTCKAGQKLADFGRGCADTDGRSVRMILGYTGGRKRTELGERVMDREPKIEIAFREKKLTKRFAFCTVQSEVPHG